MTALVTGFRQQACFAAAEQTTLCDCWRGKIRLFSRIDVPMLERGEEEGIPFGQRPSNYESVLAARKWAFARYLIGQGNLFAVQKLRTAINSNRPPVSPPQNIASAAGQIERVTRFQSAVRKETIDGAVIPPPPVPRNGVDLRAEIPPEL